MTYNAEQKQLVKQYAELVIKSIEYRKEGNADFVKQVELLLMPKRQEMLRAGIKFLNSAIQFQLSTNSATREMFVQWQQKYLAMTGSNLFYADFNFDYQNSNKICIYYNFDQIESVRELIESEMTIGKLEDNHYQQLFADQWVIPELWTESALRNYVSMTN
ncbi:hypothetical protein LMH73_007935 [Vibrio splendidus]|nr:hypothetical protein [Vibrio splendidus]MCC4883119.1 hypothetical protein [Vibrio splendidus]